MALDRAVLERQLSDIKNRLTACEQALASAGIPADGLVRQPSWRHLDADRRQVARRLRAAAAVEQRGKPAESDA